jgi:hypothetical protein
MGVVFTNPDVRWDPMLVAQAAFHGKRARRVSRAPPAAPPSRQALRAR